MFAKMFYMQYGLGLGYMYLTLTLCSITYKVFLN